MTPRDFALSGLEALINGYIALDPDGKARVREFSDRVIMLELPSLGLSLYLVPDLNGHLRLFGEYADEPDCIIHGELLDLLHSSDRQRGAGELFSGKVRVLGDTELAERFGALLGDLDVDWEEQLSRLTGDLIAHQAGRSARTARAYLADTTSTAQRNINEYLTEEARLLPARIEIRNWCDDVDDLRDDVERLAARVARLEAGKSDQGGE